MLLRALEKGFWFWIIVFFFNMVFSLILAISSLVSYCGRVFGL